MLIPQNHIYKVEKKNPTYSISNTYLAQYYRYKVMTTYTCRDAAEWK